VDATRWVRRPLVLAVAAVVLPLFVTAVVLLVDGRGADHPNADQALIELQTKDVGSDAVLVGPYSRLGWNHPGPALYYLLAVPYRLAGGAPAGLAVGALVINGAAVVGMLVLAQRRGGAPLLVATVLVLVVLMRALGAGFLADYWNPYITVLPFGLLVFLAWSMISGEVWALPAAVAVGSFLVQSHLGYAVVVAVLVGGGAAALVLRWRGARGALARLGPSAAVALVVLVVLWLPPILQELSDRPSNIDAMTEFSEEDHDIQTLADGGRAVAGQLSLAPEWVRGERRLVGFTTGQADLRLRPADVAGVVVVAAAWFLIAWRGDPAARRFQLVLAAAMAAAVVSVWRVVDVLYPYLIRWLWILGALSAALVLWGLWTALSPAVRARRARWAGAAVLVAVATTTAVNTAAAAMVTWPRDEDPDFLVHLSRPVEDAVRGQAPVLVRGEGGLGTIVYVSGIVAELERAGIDARVPRRVGYVYGYHRVLRDEGEAGTVLHVVEGLRADELVAMGGYHVVARAGTGSEAVRAEFRRGTAELRRRRAAGRLTDQQFIDGLVRLPHVPVDLAVVAEDR
jgi:hypothetical protein